MSGFLKLFLSGKLVSGLKPGQLRILSILDYRKIYEAMLNEFELANTYIIHFEYFLVLVFFTITIADFTYLSSLFEVVAINVVTVDCFNG